MKELTPCLLMQLLAIELEIAIRAGKDTAVDLLVLYLDQAERVAMLEEAGLVSQEDIPCF